MRVVIVYHRSCPDGFGAAWWLRRNLLAEHPDVEIEMVPANWGDAPLFDPAGADVWCVDYCYEAQHLVELAETAATLTVMDHHETSLTYVRDSLLPFTESIDNYIVRFSERLSRIEIVIDQTRSGVGLIAEVVREVTGFYAPHFLWNLQDRDLWRFELPDTRDVFAAVTARPYTIEAWDELNAMDQEDLVNEGRGINLYRDQLIESVAASVFWITLGDDGSGWWIPCASSPYFIGSDVAGVIAERFAGIGAYCILHDDRVQIGLRARKGEKRNVAEIAEFHGGGGHPAASGLSLDWDDFHKRVWVGLDALNALEASAHPPGSVSPRTDEQAG